MLDPNAAAAAAHHPLALHAITLDSVEANDLATGFGLRPAAPREEVKRRGRRTSQRAKHNPFVAALTVEAKPFRAGSASLLEQRVDEDGLETLEAVSVRYVDKAAFAKVFKSALRLAFDLPAGGARVFFLLLASLEPGQDEVEMAWRETGWMVRGSDVPMTLPYSTYYRGLGQLIDAGFLAPSARGTHWFWVNPERVFAGDRVRLVRDYQLGKRGKVPRDEQPRVVYPKGRLGPGAQPERKR